MLHIGTSQALIVCSHWQLTFSYMEHQAGLRGTHTHCSLPLLLSSSMSLCGEQQRLWTGFIGVYTNFTQKYKSIYRCSSVCIIRKVSIFPN